MFEVYIKISKDLSRVSEMHHATPRRAAHGDQRRLLRSRRPTVTECL